MCPITYVQYYSVMSDSPWFFFLPLLVLLLPVAAIAKHAHSIIFKRLQEDSLRRIYIQITMVGVSTSMIELIKHRLLLDKGHGAQCFRNN